jgi:transcriptional regulator with XRE-family HTH domain
MLRSCFFLCKDLEDVGKSRSAHDQETARKRPGNDQETTLTEETLINVAELGAHLKRKRELAHLSLRNVARETQISASTLSRIENGTGIPDTPTLARIARWLNIPLERIVNGSSQDGAAVVYYPQESIPDILEAHLRADPNLTPESAHALAELFRVAYAAYHRLGPK